LPDPTPLWISARISSAALVVTGVRGGGLGLLDFFTVTKTDSNYQQKKFTRHLLAPTTHHCPIGPGSWDGSLP